LPHHQAPPPPAPPPPTKKHNIQDGIAAGIDGFQLNFIGRQDQYATIYNMFEAALELHNDSNATHEGSIKIFYFV